MKKRIKSKNYEKIVIPISTVKKHAELEFSLPQKKKKRTKKLNMPFLIGIVEEPLFEKANQIQNKKRIKIIQKPLPPLDSYISENEEDILRRK
jgi:hypothetical protein